MKLLMNISNHAIKNNMKKTSPHNRTPEEKEIMRKGLICDGKPLPNFKKKKKEKIPPYPDKDLHKLYEIDLEDLFSESNKEKKDNR